LDAGVAITINSDDPAYFGGYVNANYIAAADALGLSAAEIRTIAANGFEAAFIPAGERAGMIARLDRHWAV
ncbi:MAG: adenosine deaminase, partial [Janthinobacterium lividum]